jgi:hypothetical protein
MRHLSPARDSHQAPPQSGALVLLLSAASLLACATTRPEPDPPPRPAGRNPAVQVLDQLIERVEHGATEIDAETCIRSLDQSGLCAESEQPPTRVVPFRIALDERYLEWPEPWDRLARTVACVNRFYRPTGIEWEVVDITPWDPGRYRHLLYPLLSKLQRDMPFDGRTLRLGITVWEERRIYSRGGSEIGLSQRDSCVVPSWPRVENDCVILAHELGHLIGAKHVPGKHWIMGWSASPFHLPAADPLERVAATYRFHPRNVATIKAYRSAAFTRWGLRPTEACSRRITEIDRCFAL